MAYAFLKDQNLKKHGADLRLTFARKLIEIDQCIILLAQTL